MFVHGFVKSSDPDHPTDDAEEVMADIKKCLSALVPTMVEGRSVAQRDDLNGTIMEGRLDFGTTFTEAEKSQNVGQFSQNQAHLY